MIGALRHHILKVVLLSGLFAAACQPAAPPATSQPAAPPAAAPQKPAPAKELEKVSLNLGWVVAGEHTPWFYGLDRGFYREQGLDVEIHEGKGGAVTAQSVAAGGASDMFGVADYSTMVISIDKGLPLKGVFGVMQNSPLAVLALQESGIKTLKDLEGKALALSPGGSTTQLFPVVARLNGVDEKKVQIMNSEPAALVGALLTKKVDAMIGFDLAQGLAIQAQGAKINVILYADNGANILSNGLLVSAGVVSQKQDLVRRFVVATHRAWTEAAKPENQKAAVESLIKANPQLKDQQELTTKQFLLTLEKLHTPASKGKPAGWTAKEDWESSQKLLLDSSQITNKVPVETYYTNEFIPQ